MFEVYICLFKVYRGVQGVKGSFTFTLTVFEVEIASSKYYSAPPDFKEEFNNPGDIIIAGVNCHRRCLLCVHRACVPESPVSLFSIQ